MNDVKTNGNGAKTMIVDALKGMNIPTVLLIALAGGGNILNTNADSSARHAEIDRAIKETHVVHDAIDDALKRQKELASSLNKILGNQEQIINYLRTGNELKKGP